MKKIVVVLVILIGILLTAAVSCENEPVDPVLIKKKKELHNQQQINKMEKLDYIKLVFSSWWQDMHSKKKIIKNNWHKHITISIMFIMLFAPLLKLTFTMDEAIWFQYFVLLAVPLGLYWGFERVQGMYANYMGQSRPNQFESDKDVVASWTISSVIGIIIYTILLLY